MSNDNAPNLQGLSSMPTSMVIAGVGLGLLITAAVITYMRSQETQSSRFTSALEGVPNLSWPGIPTKRRWMLASAIKMIENDGSRKVLLAILRAMAKRAT